MLADLSETDVAATDTTAYAADVSNNQEHGDDSLPTDEHEDWDGRPVVLALPAPRSDSVGFNILATLR